MKDRIDCGGDAPYLVTDDHWNNSQLRRAARQKTALSIGFAAMLVVLVSPLGHARDLDGRYANSPLKQWFDSLKSGKGPCCSDADGSALADVDWESKGGHYRVRLDGQCIDVPDEAIVERMSGRRVHAASGRTYHVKFNPPKVAGKDDLTGDALIQRDDDKEETVKKRLDVYHQQTEQLLGYYTAEAARGGTAPRYRKIAGVGSVEEVEQRLLRALGIS